MYIYNYLLLLLSRKKSRIFAKNHRMTEKDLIELRNGAEVTKVQFKERVLDNTNGFLSLIIE